LKLNMGKEKLVVIGAGPVGSLAALYAAKRGYDVEIYELRSGKLQFCMLTLLDPGSQKRVSR
jgi:kynurenine 3-monooxygenase